MRNSGWNRHIFFKERQYNRVKTANEKVYAMVTPLFLHFFVLQTVVLFLGAYCDPAELTGITAALLIPIALVLYRKEIRQYQDRERRKMDLRELIGIAVFGIAASQIVTWLINIAGVTKYFSNETQEALFAGKFFVQLLGTGICVPITEEVLFRGLIYQRMRRTVGMGWAMLLSSVLFAVYHGNLVQMIYAFPMALLLCGVYEKCDSIKGPIVLHMAANLAAVAINFLI